MKIYEIDDRKNLLKEDDYGRLYVQSSNVHSIWYKQGKTKLGTLSVEFNSGAIYEYYRVPEVVMHFFVIAPSYGRFLWKNIRGKYPYKRVK